MSVTVRHGAVRLTEAGAVGGHDAGATLVRRLLRIFPGGQVLGPQTRRGPGHDVVTLSDVDAGATVVVNMDVLDSPTVWHALAAGSPDPAVMNFVWRPPSRWTRTVDVASLALSCALFPTFCNSERTAQEIREIVAAWTVPRLAERTRLGWVNLGVRLEHVRPRQEPEIPVVLYPAIALSSRKRPGLFLDVVEHVAARTPIRVEARLDEEFLVSEHALRLSRRDWAWVGPLTASRETYWEGLARTTAFLATAEEESYGLEYVEALLAGAIGIFPDRPWVWTVVPAGYPFVYHDAGEAEEMLYRAVTETAACRREADREVGGDLLGWLRRFHDDDTFDRAVAGQVRAWFGARVDAGPAVAAAAR